MQLVPSQPAVALASVGHGVQRLPQLAGLLLSRQAPEHSWKPELQTIPHEPLEHTALPFVGALHESPHLAQWVTVPSAASQPLPMPPSQLSNPLSQTIPHDPEEQTGDELARSRQTSLQNAQLLSVPRRVSQPLDTVPSQSSNPPSHANEQPPPPHRGLELARSRHASPQLWQLARDPKRVSQPLPWPPSQLPKLELQLEI